MDSRTKQKQHFYNALFIALLLVFIPCMLFIVEFLLDIKFSFLGVLPRNFSYFHGIFTHVLVHADLSHLSNNVVSLFILSLSLFYFYGKIADKVLLFAWLLTGFMLWVIGRENIHIGASGLIYALAFFLFWSGLLRKYPPLVAIALIVGFLYGNMVWHVFPWQAFPNESWEGHLSGSLVGSVLAVVYRKQGPQRPIKQWDDTPETEHEKALAAYAESFEIEGEVKNENSEQRRENESREDSRI